MVTSAAYLGEETRVIRGDWQPASNASLELPVLGVPAPVFPGETVPVTLSSFDPALRELVISMVARDSNAAPLLAACVTDGSGSPIGRCGVTLRLKALHTGRHRTSVIAIAQSRFSIAKNAPIRMKSGVPHIIVRGIDSADEAPRLPPMMRSGCGYAPSWIWRRFDVEALCRQTWESGVSTNVISDETVKAADAALTSGTSEKAVNDANDEPQELKHHAWQCVGGSNATAFSFWLARNMPATVDVKLALLAENCTVYRLRRILELLRHGTNYACAACGHEVVHPRDLLSLTASGISGVFANPAGITFRVITARTVLPGSIDVLGPPSLDCTWYRGYGWSMCHCAGCGAHLGWRYDFMPDDSPGLRDKRVIWARTTHPANAGQGEEGSHDAGNAPDQAGGIMIAVPRNRGSGDFSRRRRLRSVARLLVVTRMLALGETGIAVRGIGHLLGLDDDNDDADEEDDDEIDISGEGSDEDDGDDDESESSPSDDAAAVEEDGYIEGEDWDESEGGGGAENDYDARDSEDDGAAVPNNSITDFLERLDSLTTEPVELGAVTGGDAPSASTDGGGGDTATAGTGAPLVVGSPQTAAATTPVFLRGVAGALLTAGDRDHSPPLGPLAARLQPLIDGEDASLGPAAQAQPEGAAIAAGSRRRPGHPPISLPRIVQGVRLPSGASTLREAVGPPPGSLPSTFYGFRDGAIAASVRARQS